MCSVYIGNLQLTIDHRGMAMYRRKSAPEGKNMVCQMPKHTMASLLKLSFYLYPNYVAHQSKNLFCMRPISATALNEATVLFFRVHKSFLSAKIHHTACGRTPPDNFLLFIFLRECGRGDNQMNARVCIVNVCN